MTTKLALMWAGINFVIALVMNKMLKYEAKYCVNYYTAMFFLILAGVCWETQ